MKTSELRVGNYYTSTKFQTPVTCEMSDIMEICIIADGTIPSERDVSSLFEPIPLTEQWLENLKFKKHDFPHNDWEKDKIRIYSGHHEWWFGWELTATPINFIENGLFKYVKLHYVHQLQNLYFALTGKELKK